MNVQAKDVAEILGGKQALGREIRDFADLDAVVEAGLSRESIIAVRAALRSIPHLAKAFTVAHASSARSRVIERTARLFAVAEQAFGSEDAAREFILTPHDRLGGKCPLESVETELAFKQVEGILDSIVFGMPA